MGFRRRCSRVTCSRAANSTLTYVYADSTAVLGPLSTSVDPHGYDLCEIHAARLTAPLGWQVVRIEPDPSAHGPTGDDLEALANAVREAQDYTWNALKHAFRPGMGQFIPDRYFWARRGAADKP